MWCENNRGNDFVPTLHPSGRTDGGRVQIPVKHEVAFTKIVIFSKEMILSPQFFFQKTSIELIWKVKKAVYPERLLIWGYLENSNRGGPKGPPCTR